MKKTMTRRERVAMALTHREPDWVPCDMTIEASAYEPLCEYLGVPFEPKWWDDWNHSYPSVEVLDKLQIDVRHIDIHDTPKDFDMEKTEFINAWGVKTVKTFDETGNFHYTMVGTPLADAETVDDILNYNHWPKPEDLVNVTNLEEEVRHLYNETDLALTATFGGSVFENSHYVRGLENFLVDLYVNEDIANALMEKVLEIQMGVDELVLKTIGKYLTYTRLHGEDLGTQVGPLMAVDMWSEHIRPYMQREWDNIKALYAKYSPDCKLSVHSCGAVSDFVDSFIEMGADMLNPVQPNAAGMETDVLKQRFGDRICFHGAINTQSVLTQGNRDDVFAEVKKRIADLAPGGGYIVSPSHNIQAGMSPENIVAMYEAVQEYGAYPLNL